MTQPDFDAVLAAAPPREQPSRALTRMADNLAPLIDVVRATLVETQQAFAVALEELQPAEREQINRLRAILESLTRPLAARLAALDQHVLLAFERAGADQLALPKGRAIKLRKPTAEYEVDEDDLRRKLVWFAEQGILTADEVNLAITQQVAYRVNHAKLNYLARHRGDRVREAIDEMRRPGPPRGRPHVDWPEPLQEDE